MLGPGRPFVIVLNNPKMSQPRDSMGQIVSIDQIQNEVNRSALPVGVEVRGLMIESNVHLAHRDIHSLGEEKQKEYACICESVDRDLSEDDMEVLNSIKDVLMITQKTPIRVSHRRTLAPR